MASSHHLLPVSHPPKEGDAVKGKQKNAAVGKNRRVLGDIGNVVAVPAAMAEGKPVTQISLPIARHVQKPVVVIADERARKVHDKEAKPKVAFKPKPDVVVIEISPDSNEVMKQRSSSRKKVHTLTSVLTARSKVACGFSDRVKDPVPDIDASDADNQLAVVDYIEDIYKFYKLSENTFMPHDYMDSQLEINARMRAILADWLLEVHHKFELMPESLYLTFYIIDRYLSLKKVLRRELQLVGISAMLIACKYEEIWSPEVNDFICIADRAYSREQILAMEKDILNTLEWSLTVPTPYVFLVRFLKAAMGDEEMENMVFFFAELGLVQYSMIKFCPSVFAASAVYAAQCTLNKNPLWTNTLKFHTGYSDAQLVECAEILVKCHEGAPQDKQKFVYKKYSSEQFGAVALHQPATRVIGDLKAK